MTLTPLQEARAKWLTQQGCKYPRTTVQEAARVGLPLSYALAFLQKESSGRDEHGRDPYVPHQGPFVDRGPLGAPGAMGARRDVASTSGPCPCSGRCRSRACR